MYREIDRNKEYELLIKANTISDHYLIMFDLANMMCFRTGEKEKGLELFSKMFKNYQWLILAQEAGLGSAYLSTRQLEMALKCFETCLAIKP